MTLSECTQVLVVGAGPNGLACAISLATLGLQVTIVNIATTNGNDSRATVVHPWTLEMLHTLGLAQPLVEAGVPSKGITFHGGSEKLFEVDMTLLRDVTEFPFALLIPQDKVEDILRERLFAKGITVLNHTVVGIKQVAPTSGLQVHFQDGSVICTRYLIGADGGRSTVRHLAGIEFLDPHTGVPYDSAPDPSSTIYAILADVNFSEPLPSCIPRDAVSLHLNESMLLIPLQLKGDTCTDTKQASFWRIGMLMAPGSAPPPKHPDQLYIQHMINTRKPWPAAVTIAHLFTASRYRVRSAVASTYFKKMGGGNVLLVGDAAHVNSPAGAQGMNLGLCDAVSLGRAIRAHVDMSSKIESDESDSPLHDYALSRRRTAIKVISMAMRLTIIENSAAGWRRWLRNTILWIAGRLSFVQRFVAWRISGLIHRDA